jgi:hypothetical protein
MNKRRLITELIALALPIVLPSAYPAQAQSTMPGLNCRKCSNRRFDLPGLRAAGGKTAGRVGARHQPGG